MQCHASPFGIAFISDNSSCAERKLVCDLKVTYKYYWMTHATKMNAYPAKFQEAIDLGLHKISIQEFG